jgi:type III pantothenate kinase
MVGHVLLLDCGNTRIKYYFKGVYGFLGNVSELDDFLDVHEVCSVKFASVSGNAEQLKRICTEKSVDCCSVVVDESIVGLKVAYANPIQLGVDRWLAMVGALSLTENENIIVVDAGTALKIDVIVNGEKHIGGSISPGLNLSRSVLNQRTAQLPEVGGLFSGSLGTDTHSCINYGVVMSQVALIERCMVEFGASAEVFLTGGDAKYLSEFLKVKFSIVKNLPLIGLRMIFEE